jgi:ligand-binding sensor domain-containing protein
LFEYNDGQMTREWHAGRELPAAVLTSLAVRTGSSSPELWIATSGAGIVRFDGNNFRQLLPRAQEQREISALLPLKNSRVLVGTSNAGLYVSDGESLRNFHPQFAKAKVTALAGEEDDFWIGTRNEGAWHWRGGEAVSIRSELPDPQVLSMAAAHERAWIGTALGVTEFANGKLDRHLADGVFARAVAEQAGTLWIGTVDQGTFALLLNERLPRPQIATHHDTESAIAFASLPDGLLAIEPREIVRLPEGEAVVSAPTPSLAAGHISALLEDTRGRLWIGYFDRGLDILDPSAGGRINHVEDDVLFCVNRIKENPNDGSIAVATANGLAIFDRTEKLRQILDRSSGLIASNVTDLLFRADNSTVFATPAGLTFLDHGSLASMYAFHGLVNNHVYTLAQTGDALYVGTLGGFSEIRNGLVQASFTTANSQLHQNWITASAKFDGALFLGTYGSGVVRVDRQGAITSYPAFTARRYEINLNAMVVTDRALYAGTAGQGIAILRTGSTRWEFEEAGLPSRNVTALEAHAGRIYAGTENGLVQITENNLLP